MRLTLAIVTMALLSGCTGYVRVAAFRPSWDAVTSSYAVYIAADAKLTAAEKRILLREVEIGNAVLEAAGEDE